MPLFPILAILIQDVGWVMIFQTFGVDFRIGIPLAESLLREFQWSIIWLDHRGQQNNVALFDNVLHAFRDTSFRLDLVLVIGKLVHHPVVTIVAKSGPGVEPRVL